MKAVPISKVSDIIRGVTFGKNEVTYTHRDEALPVLRATNILEDGTLSFDEMLYVDKKRIKEKHMIKNGDVVIAASTGSKKVIGKAAQAQFDWEGGFGGFCMVLRPHPEIDAKYFGYFFQSKGYREKISYMSSGVNINNLKKRHFDELVISLPSLDEQKRLVSILDQVEAVRRKRKESIRLLGDYVQSLFLEMFGDPIKNPKGITIKTLGEIASKVTDGTHKTPKYVASGVRFISAKNIKNGRIDWRETRHITKLEHDEISRRCDPQRGDILLTKSGSLGMAALVDVNEEFSLFESLALIRVKNDLIESEYLKEYLNLKQISQHYLQRSKGVAVKHLHLIDIKSLPVVLPPKEDQFRFIKIKRHIEGLQAKMSDQSKLLDNQFNSLMQKSFAGHL